MIDINIGRVDNGFVVRAGCMTLAFNNRAELAVELTRWLENPDKVEAEYISMYRKPTDMAGQGVIGAVDEGCSGSVRYHAGDARVPFPGGGIEMPTDTLRRRPLEGIEGADGPDSLGAIRRSTRST